MARSQKIVCDKCGHEEDFTGRLREGWGLLEVVPSVGTRAPYELCPKCTEEASPKP